MIEPTFRFDDFTKSAKGSADLRRTFSELLSGLPQPTLSAHERRLMESEVILRPLDSAELSTEEMLHPRLTILASDLTNLNELTRLRQLAERIQAARNHRLNLEPRKRFRPSLYVLGPGAEYSQAFRYRSPEAQQARDSLSAIGVIFFERPAGATDDQLRSHMEGLLSHR